MSKENPKFEMLIDFDGDILKVRASLWTVEEVDKFIRVVSVYSSLLPSKSVPVGEEAPSSGNDPLGAA